MAETEQTQEKHDAAHARAAEDDDTDSFEDAPDTSLTDASGNTLTRQSLSITRQGDHADDAAPGPGASLDTAAHADQADTAVPDAPAVAAAAAAAAQPAPSDTTAPEPHAALGAAAQPDLSDITAPEPHASLETAAQADKPDLAAASALGTPVTTAAQPDAPHTAAAEPHATAAQADHPDSAAPGPEAPVDAAAHPEIPDVAAAPVLEAPLDTAARPDSPDVSAAVPDAPPGTTAQPDTSEAAVATAHAVVSEQPPADNLAGPKESPKDTVRDDDAKPPASEKEAVSGQESRLDVHAPHEGGAAEAGAQDTTNHVPASAGDGKEGEKDMAPPSIHSRNATLESVPELPPQVPDKDPKPEPVKGLSGDLPELNYPPPPPPPGKPQTSPVPHPPPPTRKVSSPFAWFARARKATSPSRPTSPRRDTAASMQTLGSNPDSTDDAPHQASLQASLKDRFQQLRIQGESALSADDNSSTRPIRSGSLQSSVKSESGSLSPPFIPRSNSFSAVSSPTLQLPPGTAAGIIVGPSEDQAAVNWDLWQSVVYEGPSAVARTSGDELSRAIASGIPQPIRGVVWQVLADSKNEELELVYRDLVARGTDKEVARPSGSRRVSGGPEKEPVASSASSIRSDASTPAANMSPGINGNDGTATERKRRSKDGAAALQKLEKTIRRDLGARTAYSKYLASAGLQDGLFGMCKAYALYDEAVGYAQGMNFIAMPLLFNMPEEEAFTLLVKLMSKYNVRSLFTADMPGLHLHLYQFERLLEDFEPALYCHLHRRGVPPNLYATQWFLTLFAYRFPLQLVLRVYDLVLSEGLSAIVKFGIALMQRNAQTLMGMKDMVHLSTHLKEKLFDVYIDKTPSASSILESGFFGAASGGADKEVYRADELVRDAVAVKISPETLAAYTSEYEEKTRLEKERETELETLRANNLNLGNKVRSLEERAQQHDTEHVGIASELVRTKVENDKLEDENESLKMQVQELRKIADGQPAEVEEKLRGEMERIMQRNIEVQNTNRALEETVQETEQELVGTKMMFAQLNAEHDALKQKLTNVQNMLAQKD